jgi:hypothetical protein
MVFLETSDGGKTWLTTQNSSYPLPDRSATSFDWISFRDPNHGWILGATVSGSVDEPGAGWLEPDRFPVEDQVRSNIYLFRTADHGQSWQVDNAPVSGSILRVAASPEGEPLVVTRLQRKYGPPTDVLNLNIGGGQPFSIFRRLDRVVTDIAVAPDRTVYLATIQPPGTSLAVPIPGKLRVFQSKIPENWVQPEWEDMNVDYRAVGLRAIFATAGTDVFIATDTGMILKLVRE